MTYKTDRKVAARLLKVSIRTVDRYISGKKLSTENKDGRIWLDRKEIQELKKKKQVDKIDTMDKVEKSKMSIDKTVSTPVDMSIDSVDIVSTRDSSKISKTRREHEDGIFKKLYEELKKELNIKQDRLEGANYRVGQLEAMVKESVPLIEHQKIISQETAARLELEENTESLHEKIKKSAKTIKEEKLSKTVYFVALFIILLLQPLWLLLAMK
jgi:hypothetical protein